MFKASFTICLLMLFFQSSAYAAGIDKMLLEKFSSSDLSTLVCPPVDRQKFFYDASGGDQYSFSTSSGVL